jgi:imidazolonepropionase-like amidohydrolase
MFRELRAFAHFLIQNARVFDGDRVTPHTSVLVRNGKISKMGPPYPCSQKRPRC